MENNDVKKVPPAVVQERLARDVYAILKVCIQHFDEATGTEKDECFDVDAIVSGRSVATVNPYARRVIPARYALPAERFAVSQAPLTRPQKGYFIPHAYASGIVFA